MKPTQLAGFLVGLEGVALLRAEVEGSAPGFVEARLGELADILGSLERVDDGYEPPVVVPMDTTTGYSLWAASYDGPNPLIAVEEPAVRRLLDSLPACDVLDAACGTGRHAQYLAARGHTVVGVDACQAMLDIAAAKVPEAEFHLADITELPVEDRSMDLVVCSLALTHQAALTPAFGEFARVLRPGGRLVTSDIHHLSLYFGGVAAVEDGEGRTGRMPASRFLPSDYLRAALESRYIPLACEEVPWPDLADGHGGPIAQTWCPDAARAAYVGLPAVIIWDLQVPR